MGWFERAKRVLLSGTASFAESGENKRAANPQRQWAFEPLEPRLTLAAAGLVPVEMQPVGPLTGKVVYTSGGHGWEYFSSWSTNRPNLNGMIEGFGNQDQIDYFADYLLRAGATVVSMRPVGHQLNEVVLDNDSAGVSFSGSWSNNTVGPRWYDEDYGAGTDAIKYRFANVSGSETATATYTPTISEAGLYPVYTWAAHGGNRTSQLYKINHTGGQTQIRVDHRDVGNGWVYLGTYHFDAGSSTTDGSVVISNQSTAGGSVVIADSIRFGNGMGDLPDGPSGLGTGSDISDQPREDEAAIFWIWRGFGEGASPGSVIGSGNVSGPSDYAEHMNAAPFGTSVYIGFHSNAGGGRGAVGLIDNNNPTPNQSSLALYTGRQINQDMQALNGQFEHNWSTRTTHTFSSGFGEINLGSNAEMDATIIEVAFHDSQLDAELMRDPKVRDQLGRSTYEAALEYFDHFGGVSTTTTLPSAPTNVSAVSNSSGEVTVSWLAGPSSSGGYNGVNGSPATGFRIYASVDGYGFDGGTFVTGGSETSATLTGYDPDIPYYFKVVAENAGGRSKASEVVTALPSGGLKQVLIVNGYDRFDRAGNIQYTSQPPLSTGVSDRVWERYGNSFDYVVQVHEAIHGAEPGVEVASTSNEAVISGAVDLNDFHAVIWILGEESTVDDTFNATEQTKVEQFIAGGGNLFLSGAEIGWDLDFLNNGRSFFENTLKGNYVSDDAGTYNVTAAGGSIFAGLPNFSFSDGSPFSNLDGQFYDADFPDVISPQSGAQLALNYSGGTGGGAAIQASGTGGRGSVVMFGFPFETITSAARRVDVMDRVLEFFNVSAEMPGIEIQQLVDGQDADSPPGPTLAAGSSATFTYVVSNTGNVALSNVAVVDDNGTPGDTNDDFSPTLISGDTNGNSILDVGEVWNFSASRTVAAGTYSGSAAVSAEDGMSQLVAGSDTSNYFGSAPAIDVIHVVNGEDADSPTGPMLPVGSTANVAYIVTNEGNVPLANVTATDDNGTPGDTGDDFNVAYISGDTNLNDMLDAGEVWVFLDMRTVTAGQHTNIGTVTAEDSIAQTVEVTDPINYFGVVENNADFNNNGTVDAADYILWRKSNGTSVTPGTLGDADNSGNVDEADYGIWQGQFGSSPGGGSGGESSEVAEQSPDEEKAERSTLSAAENTLFGAPEHVAEPIQDAAFDGFSHGRRDLRTLHRKSASLEDGRIWRANGDGNWNTLLMVLAERRVAPRSAAEPAPFGTGLDNWDGTDETSDSIFSDELSSPQFAKASR